MAEPVSVTGVCAAAATAVASGGTGGAAAAGTAAGTGAAGGAAASGGVGTAATALGTAAGTGTQVGAAAGAVPAGGDGATGTAASGTGSAVGNVIFRVFETGRQVAPEPVDPSILPEGFTGEVVAMHGTEFKTVRELVDAASEPSSPVQRADSSQPQAVHPDQTGAGTRPESAGPRSADPNPGQRGTAELPQRVTAHNDRPELAGPEEEAPTQPQRAHQEEPDPSYITSRRPRQLGPADPSDPHERERIRLDMEMGRYDEMTPTEQLDFGRSLDVWFWRDRERYPDETPVIGPHGHMGRDAYEKKKRRVEAEQSLADQLELGRSISQGNPLSSSVALYIYSETGDPIAAAEGGDAVAGVTGGGKGSKGKPLARSPRERQAAQQRTRAKRNTARRKAKRTGKRKGAEPGKPQEKDVRNQTSSPPRSELTPRQRGYQKEVQRLIETLHPQKQKRVTVAVLIVEKAGRREVWISTSLEKPPPQIEKAARRGHRLLRGSKSDPRNKGLPQGEKLTHHHAEHDGISIALSNGYKVIEVYPSRPACNQCSEFRSLGYTVIDPG